jgi:hypothetical protein
MKFTVNDTPNEVSLLFTFAGEVKSISIRKTDFKKMTVEEGITALVSRLAAMVMPEVDVVYEIDDEDDADLSLYDVAIEVEGYTPREYLESIGAV